MKGDGIMERLNFIYSAAFGLLILMLAAGCSGYGSLRNESGHSNGMKIQELAKNWDDYHVYYSGYDVNNPSGIMFDPKNDDKVLTPSDWWVKIDNESDVSEVISWIDIHDYPWYYAQLHRIIGPDGEFYGFIYTGWHEIVTKATDDKTLFVYDLPDPPQYYGPTADFKVL
jgi:hypothetical protein